MKREIDNILAALKIQPVLIDIGASGTSPSQWRPIARRSIYIGFDPDQREMRDIPDGQYARSIIFNEGVTSLPGQSEVHFYLTHSPYCSSTLLPDTEALSQYLFSDLFTVEKEVLIRASSLNAVIDRLSLHGVDWFKTDSQGTDLRLFQSLRDELRNRILAVDIEPGLIDAYRGEDLFVDAHRELLRQGFWLSSLDVKGSVRMKRATFQVIASRHPGLKDSHIYEAVRSSPGWCEARYLRTIESLSERNADTRDYALLWVFAMIERQWGYALDIAQAYKQRFGHDYILDQLQDASFRKLQRRTLRTVRSSFKAIVPVPLKKLLHACYNKDKRSW